MREQENEKQMPTTSTALVVPPEFLALTTQLDTLGDQIDALRAKRKALDAPYKEVQSKIVEYMQRLDLPRLDTASGHSSIGRVTKRKERTVNEELLREVVREVVPGATDDQLTALWPAVKRRRFVTTYITIDRKVNAAE